MALIGLKIRAHTHTHEGVWVSSVDAGFSCEQGYASKSEGCRGILKLKGKLICTVTSVPHAEL